MDNALIKKEAGGLFKMTSANKVVDFGTFRKAPDQFTKGTSVNPPEKAKSLPGDKDYKQLIKTELMMEALKEAGIDQETTDKVVSIIESKSKPKGVRARLDEKKKAAEDKEAKEKAEKKKKKEEKEAKEKAEKKEKKEEKK